MNSVKQSSICALLSAVVIILCAGSGHGRELQGIQEIAQPFIIAHRGGAATHPENTMEAFRAALAAGNRFVEADCFLLADGTVGVMHDTTLDRTTTTSGPTAAQTAATWARLRIAGLKLAGWPGEIRPPMLGEIVKEFGNRAVLVLEAKNAGCGRAIVDELNAHNIRKDLVLINSFLIDELTPAVEAGYPACFNEKDLPQFAVKPDVLISKGIRWVAIGRQANQAYIDAAKSAGIGVIIGTINRRSDWQRYVSMGIAGCYSSDPLYLTETNPIFTRDNYDSPQWRSGDVSNEDYYRGVRETGSKQLVLPIHPERFRSVLLGWLDTAPLADRSVVAVVEFSVQVGAIGSALGWVEVILTPDDTEISWKHRPGAPGPDALEFVLKPSGEIEIIEISGGLSRSLAVAKAASSLRELSGDYIISFSRGTVGFGKKNSAIRVTAPVSIQSPRYLTLGAGGVEARYGKVSVRGLK
jgi:glycerophosphoryl diester phosphodiesterase